MLFTKKGDKGKSSTIDKKEIAKSSLVFDVVGTFDELNSWLGLVKLNIKKVDKDLVEKIQQNILNFSAIIAGYKNSKQNWEMETKSLEAYILKNQKYIQKTGFILPGKNRTSAGFHIARTVCRRGERKLSRYYSQKKSSKLAPIVRYVNRLSDFLYLMGLKY